MAWNDRDSGSPEVEGPERRRGERHAVLFPATFQTLVGDEHLCVSQDVNNFGGLFLTAAEYEPGEKLAIEIYLDGSDMNPQKTSGRVVRVRRRKLRNPFWLYDTAVEFDSPSRNLTVAAKSLSQRQRLLGLFDRT